MNTCIGTCASVGGENSSEHCGEELEEVSSTDNPVSEPSSSVVNHRSLPGPDLVSPLLATS